MITREQLYSKEVGSLLRDITTYHCMKGEQLKRLYHMQEDKLERLLTYIVKQGRIYYDAQKGIYYDSPDMQTDSEMLAAIWVLTDFGDKTEYHSTDSFPTQIIFFADGETYEIIYVPQDKETLILHAMNMRHDNDCGKKILIVECVEQIENIELEGAIFCTVDMKNGDVQYYKKE
ncbi:MAG: hypothetical protein IJ011_00245 [Clostridia bacterium]|nr:hypothetical protein [Clostridia bacterium]